MHVDERGDFNERLAVSKGGFANAWSRVVGDLVYSLGQQQTAAASRLTPALADIYMIINLGAQLEQISPLVMWWGPARSPRPWKDQNLVDKGPKRLQSACVLMEAIEPRPDDEAQRPTRRA